MATKNKSTDWVSACRKYAGTLYDGKDGLYLILTQDSQLTLIRENKERINASK